MSHQPDNIFAGTQVASLVEVRHSLVHPHCVTPTHADTTSHFVVQFRQTKRPASAGAIQGGRSDAVRLVASAFFLYHSVSRCKK
jgi:hypothetical protein